MNRKKLFEIILSILCTQQVFAQPAQTIGLNFTAANVIDTFQGMSTPPQQNGWVGPEQYILMSYGIIRSFNKFTGQPDGVLNIDANSFFGPTNVGISANDVRIDYSRYADRWFMSCENVDPNLYYSDQLLIAWSDSGVITPQTVWTIHTFTNEQIVPQYNPINGPAFLDYEQLATDANAVYISVDTFNSTDTAELGASVVVIPNSSFIAGNPFNYTVLPGILGPSYPSDLQNVPTPAADNFDPSPTFGYLINPALNISPYFSSGNLLSFFRIINPGSNNATLGPLINVPIQVYAYADGVGNPFGNCPHKGNLYGTAGYLQNSGADFAAPHVRNKQLYACLDSTLDSTGTGNLYGDRNGIIWWQFDLTGDPTGKGQGIETESTVPAVVQSGVVYDSSPENPQNYFISATMTNKNGDLVIVGTTSGANNYTNVFYAGRKATDSLGTLREPVLITNNPGNAYNWGPLATAGIGQRWGDLSSVCPDPSNDLDIWSTGEWAGLPNGWAIQATQLIPAAA